MPANETRREERGVVKRRDECVPSVRESDADEPFTPDASVRTLVEETATSERFCGRKNPPLPLAGSAYVFVVEKLEPDR